MSSRKVKFQQVVEYESRQPVCQPHLFLFVLKGES